MRAFLRVLTYFLNMLINLHPIRKGLISSGRCRRMGTAPAACVDRTQVPGRPVSARGDARPPVCSLRLSITTVAFNGFGSHRKKPEPWDAGSPAHHTLFIADQRRMALEFPPDLPRSANGGAFSAGDFDAYWEFSPTEAKARPHGASAGEIAAVLACATRCADQISPRQP